MVAGRPKSELDWNEIGKLLTAGCKTIDIASQFGVDVTTLYDRCEKDLGIKYSHFSQESKSKGDNLLRAVQFKTAMEGNTSMQIWLGKNRLDQKDETNITASFNVQTIDFSNADTNDNPTPQVLSKELPT